MAKRTKRKATKAAKKPCKTKACRKRRRSLRGLGDGHMPGATKKEKAARMARIQAMWSAQNRAEVARAGLIQAPASAALTTTAKAAISPSNVNASEARAAKKGCVAPRGKVCVDKSVGYIKKAGIRFGCVKAKGIKDTYICTTRAVTQHGKGKHVAQGQESGAGYRFVSMRKAIAATGKFKAGCKYNIKAGKAACKKV